MATQIELKRLALNWSLVIKKIYPEIDVVVKGDPDSIDTLLSVWETGDDIYERPTEAQLLAALSNVEADIVQQEAADRADADEIAADLAALGTADANAQKAILERMLRRQEKLLR